MASAHDFTFPGIDHKPIDLKQYKGRPVLVVNVASFCGFTPQYKELQKLHESYGPKGLVVLGVPSNDFGAQEPKTEPEIAQFCQTNYGVTFPMMAKVEVNGSGADPLWKWLKSEAPGVLGTEGIKWNFTKFLVNRQGEVVSRHAPKDKPEDLEGAITALL